MLAGDMESHMYLVRKYTSSQLSDANYSASVSEDRSVMCLAFAVQIEFYTFRWRLQCSRVTSPAIFIREHFVFPLIQIASALATRPQVLSEKEEVNLAKIFPSALPEAVADLYRRILDPSPTGPASIPTSDSLTFSSFSHSVHGTHTSTEAAPASTTHQPPTLDETAEELAIRQRMEKELQDKKAKAAAKAKKKRKFV